jgi:hypothetical protein
MDIDLAPAPSGRGFSFLECSTYIAVGAIPSGWRAIIMTLTDFDMTGRREVDDDTALLLPLLGLAVMPLGKAVFFRDLEGRDAEAQLRRKLR